MDIVRLGKKGQVSLPAGALRKLGLQGAATLTVETTEDGALVLRPAASAVKQACERPCASTSSPVIPS